MHQSYSIQSSYTQWSGCAVALSQYPLVLRCCRQWGWVLSHCQWCRPGPHSHCSDLTWRTSGVRITEIISQTITLLSMYGAHTSYIGAITKISSFWVKFLILFTVQVYTYACKSQKGKNWRIQYYEGMYPVFRTLGPREALMINPCYPLSHIKRWLCHYVCT